MHEVELPIPAARFRAALETGLVLGLLPQCDHLVLSMPSTEMRAVVEELVSLMVGRELRWIRDHHMPCNLRLTDADRTFVFAFERLGDALLFQSVWVHGAVEANCC